VPRPRGRDRQGVLSICTARAPDVVLTVRT